MDKWVTWGGGWTQQEIAGFPFFFALQHLFFWNTLWTLCQTSKELAAVFFHTSSSFEVWKTTKYTVHSQKRSQQKPPAERITNNLPPTAPRAAVEDMGWTACSKQGEAQHFGRIEGYSDQLIIVNLKQEVPFQTGVEGWPRRLGFGMIWGACWVLGKFI